MSTVSGACMVSKLSGMCYVREDVTPSILEWKSIEQQKTISIPLKNLVNLQATKESSPKMILKVIYKETDAEQEQDIKLTFSNRPTMNNIKEALQMIVSRQRTVVNDDGVSSRAGTPAPGDISRNSTPTSGQGQGRPSTDLNINASGSLSDTSLLKNHQLQQKLLLEDKSLRNLFTQSVINFKLSPNMFWSTRLSILRTYALTLSQHRGPYNVLSTIKPVATSDNQVNVNVTRTIINEIFQTYPIVEKAFNELVPAKFQEGEFWSRFFNSKLFRRLRGDKINNANERGDMVLDKYLYLEEEKKSGKMDQEDEDVDKFINLETNEYDNSVKLGNKPDFTMKFENDQNNEMIVLMKNMNKLSKKMISQVDVSVDSRQDRKESEVKGYEEELNLHDLNPVQELRYIDLKISNDIQNKSERVMEPIDTLALHDYLASQIFVASDPGISLTDKFTPIHINASYSELNNLIKLNHRTFKLINSSGVHSSNHIIPAAKIEEIINLNLTTNEFLTHFWKIFLNESNPNQLKKLHTNLRACKKRLLELKDAAIAQINANSTEKTRDKNLSDFNYILSPLFNSMDKALGDYVRAAKETDDLNENGKRRLDDQVTSV